MKKWKIALLVIGAAVLYWYFVDSRIQFQPSGDNMSIAEMHDFYDAANEAYFENKLPKDVLIDYTDHNDKSMAYTEILLDGRFHIAFNRKYSNPPQVGDLTILHEQCHVKTFTEDLEHGHYWYACMDDLNRQGAFLYELAGPKR